MVFSVKEMFLSVQGEGVHTGRPSVFCRFSGCNLWTGREQDRAKAICKFCDTEFVGTDGLGGGQFQTASELASAARAFWIGQGEPWIICTGGEPLLQLDAGLIAAFKAAGFKVAIETNGTIKAPADIDWICVSPKADAPLVQRSGDELKLVYPQDENHPGEFTDLDFTHFALQPKELIGDEEASRANRDAAFEYCLKHPRWRLSLQTHKWLGVR